jgi:hypothetical protein
MSKEVKFTDEEVETIQKIRDSFDALTVKLGQTEIGILNLKSSKLLLVKELENLKAEETEVVKSITDKYGDGQLDVNTGFFIPQ